MPKATKNNNSSNSPKIDKERLVLELILECNAALEGADKTIAEIYQQYHVQEADAPTLAVIGIHINKTAELKLKAIAEKVKLAEALHKIDTDQKQLKLAMHLANQRRDSEGTDLAGLYAEEEEEQQEPDDTSELYGQSPTAVSAAEEDDGAETPHTN